MKKTKFLPPYRKEAGKDICTFRDTVDKSGVYIIKEGTEIVYIGFSGTNLYRTLYRHYQKWNDGKNKQYRAKLSKYSTTVRVVLCTPAQAYNLEQVLIQKHNPVKNKSDLQLFFNAKKAKSILEQYKEATGEDLPF